MLPIIVIVLPVAALFTWWIILAYRNRNIPSVAVHADFEYIEDNHLDEIRKRNHECYITDITTNAYGIYGDD
ncbi:hypothetical protein Dacet_0562 [Denitrovibrio acetiphilus DSM 12809]|uniref:Uncharacterized protein n=1 Tax=Denitrovibrio acetiphilus (strain DSM 12809 / NBRC 114555 / N2460) TaxID=522772 RepID=D4H449_DENA2|nr:hypothetical protein [Denitrovibrio acetiphilus]ADD67360.1 hypothetical protein Dacet_0562 [Denitrovibrio acetiphilus DSM 12809]